MEKEFYHFECLKSLSNIPELQLQEYCNILKKLKEEFVVHRFRDFHSYDSSFNFSNPMQINIAYWTTLILGDVYIPSSTCTCSRAAVSMGAAPKLCTVHESRVEVNGSTGIGTVA